MLKKKYNILINVNVYNSVFSVLLEDFTASSDHKKNNIIFAQTFKTTLV